MMVPQGKAPSAVDDDPILSGLSKTHALMAAAVDYENRASNSKVMIDMYKALGRVKVNQQALEDMPQSKNIEDRRDEDYPNRFDQLMEESFDPVNDGLIKRGPAR